MDLRFINEVFHRKIRKSSLRPGDVVIVRTGTPGTASVIPEWVTEANCADLVIVRPGSRLDSRYLAYVLNSFSRGQIDAYTVGAVQQHFNVGSAKQLPVPCPSFTEQRAIVAVLGALDDKIELNQRMNRVLEDMAHVIFKSWFVDLDPVVAKAAGRRPFGLSRETALAFPGRFEESELGPTPESWKRGRLSATVEICGGGTPSTSVSEYWNGEIPWFSVSDSPGPGQIFVLDTERKITERGLAESATELLREGTTIVTARGTVGNVALTGVPMAMNQSCYGLSGKDGLGSFYTYFQTREVVEELKQRAHGSVFDTITRQTFDSIDVLIPPLPIAQSFERLVRPFFDRVKSNLLEVRTLVALRDKLLPRLLSGEIRVRNAGKLREREGI